MFAEWDGRGRVLATVERKLEQVALSCRICGAELTRTFVDLGLSPLCESFVPSELYDSPEQFIPLHVRICDECLLVQLPSYLPADAVFTDAYNYFSSYSTSWVEHARIYVETMTERLGLGADSLVTEVASNDGYLLQHFLATGIPVVGVEPTGRTADAAIEKGIRTEKTFLGLESGRRLAERYGRADLVVGNNVFAHVPDLDDFVGGLAQLLGETGMVTLEFPHLLQLMANRQYDTIYHEHYHYLTLRTAQAALALHDLVVVDVEELTTHGGSLRIYAQHQTASQGATAAVADLLAKEAAAGLDAVEGHLGFAAEVSTIRNDLVEFLIKAQREGRTVLGYGAPGKGNTLLNHCGIKPDLLPFTVDMNPHKHGMFLPGTRIPIRHPDELAAAGPDYVLILPWNLKQEIAAQLAPLRAAGTQFVVPIPELEVF